MMRDTHTASSVAFFLAGLGIGAILALLFAPKSGKETRKFFIDKADEGREYAAARGKELRKQAEGFMEKGKDLVAKFAS